MNKLLLIDPLGAANGMRRWHENFVRLASKIFQLTIFSNYDSDVTKKSFIYDKTQKAASVRSILNFSVNVSKYNTDKVVLAHYGESFNSLLFLPALLKFHRKKRYLLIHDAVSTLKNERKSLLNKLSGYADSLLLAAFDNLIVHNNNFSAQFPKKKVTYLPLPPAQSSITSLVHKRHAKYLFWGFFKRSKNVEFIMELASVMPECTFDIYGTFISEEYKASFLKSHLTKKTSNVNFFELFLDEDKVGHLLSRYDAVLMPYTFITNSGILQTNADYGAISVTSDLPAFKMCSDISVNLSLTLIDWKNYLESLDEKKIGYEKERIRVSNKMRLDEFMERLQSLGE